MTNARAGFNPTEIPPWERDFPEGWTASELLDTDFPQPRWAVPGLIAEGLTLLVGAPKLGKSWLALNIACAVASGGHALGRIPVDEGDALYLALEDPGRRLKDRLRIVLDGDPAPKRLHLFPSWPQLHDGGIEMLDAWLDQHPTCRVVVVDVFAKVRGQTSDREDRYSADYRQMTALKELADRHGVAVVVIHHTRKQASEDFMDLVSGTNGLAGASDSIIVLARSRGSADAKLHLTGRDVEEAEHALKLIGGRWTMLEGPASDYETTDQRRRILNVLRNREGLGPKAIAESAGLSHDVVKQLVRKMVNAGELDTDGDGHYFPPIHSIHSVHPIGERGEQGEQLDMQVIV